MANRNFNQFSLALEKLQVNLFASATIGSTGACTLVTANSKGIASITRNSAGNYTIVLQDKYYKFLDFSVTTKNASGVSAAPNVGMISNNMSTPSINFVMSTGGTPTDPASGDTLYMRITASNSSAV